jgi:hypothetical protein
MLTPSAVIVEFNLNNGIASYQRYGVPPFNIMSELNIWSAIEVI